MLQFLKYLSVWHWSLIGTGVLMLLLGVLIPGAEDDAGETVKDATQQVSEELAIPDTDPIAPEENAVTDSSSEAGAAATVAARAVNETAEPDGAAAGTTDLTEKPLSSAAEEIDEVLNTVLDIATLDLDGNLYVGDVVGPGFAARNRALFCEYLPEAALHPNTSKRANRASATSRALYEIALKRVLIRLL